LETMERLCEVGTGSLPIIWSAKEEEEVELCSAESVNVLTLPRKIPLVSGLRPLQRRANEQRQGSNALRGGEIS
jgi:hypothetical protein